MVVRRRVPAVVTATAALAVLAACAPLDAEAGDEAAPPSTAPATSAAPSFATDALPAEPVPTGAVTVRTVVVDAGDAPELCPGPQFSIAPPFPCRGAPVAGLDWDAIDGEDALSGTRWATLDMQGTYDGTTFTLTATPELVDLSLPATGTPSPFPTEPPTDAQLAVEASVRDELGARAIDVVTFGDVLVSVLYDDGSLQAYLDARHGDGVTQVMSVMTLVTP